LEFGLPIILFPLDVSERVHLLESTLTPDLGLAPEELELLRTISKTYMEFHQETAQFRGAFVHDALPVAASIDPSLFEYRQGAVDCSDGATQTRWVAPAEAGSQVEVAVVVDETRLLRLFWDQLKQPTVVCKPAGESPGP
jgi:inosine-uridine nucleoside N-ribohydrolase